LDKRGLFQNFYDRDRVNTGTSRSLSSVLQGRDFVFVTELDHDLKNFQELLKVNLRDTVDDVERVDARKAFDLSFSERRLRLTKDGHSL